MAVAVLRSRSHPGSSEFRSWRSNDATVCDQVRWHRKKPAELAGFFMMPDGLTGQLTLTALQVAATVLAVAEP